jgi:hypothetical protein
MMVEFWLADWFGRAWLRLHGSLRPKIGDLPDECALVARGERLPASRLWRAQDFAVRAWARFAIAMIVPLFPVGFAVGIFSGLPAAEIVVTGLFFAILCAAAAAMGQAAMIRYRSDQNRRYWIRAGQAARDEPLPEGSRGLPAARDFWIMLTLTTAVFLVLLYAGTRSAHH